MEPSVALARIVEQYGELLDWAIVSQEHHQDGNLHLHAAICLAQRCNYRKADCLDWVAEKHGNYAPWKAGKLAVIKYVTKEGFKICSEGIAWEVYILHCTGVLVPNGRLGVFWTL